VKLNSLNSCVVVVAVVVAAFKGTTKTILVLSSEKNHSGEKRYLDEKVNKNQTLQPMLHPKSWVELFQA
jgi:hypothetical protein